MSDMTITKEHMIAMLGDPAFYDQCPHFLWLKDAAMQAREAQGDNIATEHMCHIFNAFFKNLKELYELEPKILWPIRTYLAGRRRSHVGKITIQYLDASKKAALFTF